MVIYIFFAAKIHFFYDMTKFLPIFYHHTKWKLFEKQKIHSFSWLSFRWTQEKIK